MIKGEDLTKKTLSVELFLLRKYYFRNQTYPNQSVIIPSNYYQTVSIIQSKQ